MEHIKQAGHSIHPEAILAFHVGNVCCKCQNEAWYMPRLDLRPTQEPKVLKVPPECFSSSGFNVASLAPHAQAV